MERYKKLENSKNWSEKGKELEKLNRGKPSIFFTPITGPTLSCIPYYLF